MSARQEYVICLLITTVLVAVTRHDSLFAHLIADLMFLSFLACWLTAVWQERKNEKRRQEQLDVFEKTYREIVEKRGKP